MAADMRNPGAGSTGASANSVPRGTIAEVAQTHSQNQPATLARAVAPPFGPWVLGIDPGERTAQFRTLAALSAAFLGSSHPLVAELRNAERDQAAADPGTRNLQCAAGADPPSNLVDVRRDDVAT
jgi:hypothetical protein